MSFIVKGLILYGLLFNPASRYWTGSTQSWGQRRQSGSTLSGITSRFTCRRVCVLSSGSPVFMFSPPDCNTSDSAFLCGLGDHQKTTLIARFQPDTAVPPRAEDVVVFSPRHVQHSPLMGMTGRSVSRQSGCLKTLSTPKNTFCPADGHTFTLRHHCAFLRYLRGFWDFSD